MSEQRKTTPELMKELQNRIIIPLEENEIQCPTCKGLRFVYKQKNDKEGYIESCKDCYNGKLYVCKYCGKTNKTDYCDCNEAEEERKEKFNTEVYGKEQKLFEKANKVKFKDYNGRFILDGDAYVKDSDDVYDWLYDKIVYDKLTDEELPKFLWGTQSQPAFSLDIRDIISDKTEDGYEDMYSNLDTDDENLDKAQEYLDKWYEKQGDRINVYYEDHKVAVLLDDVIKELREGIKESKNE